MNVVLPYLLLAALGVLGICHASCWAVILAESTQSTYSWDVSPHAATVGSMIAAVQASLRMNLTAASNPKHLTSSKA
jgi:hypothetical protein